LKCGTLLRDSGYLFKPCIFLKKKKRVGCSFIFYLDIGVENFTYKLYYIFYVILRRLVKYSPYATY